MTVKQISVFIENSQGSLSPFCRLLSEQNIDLIALSIADTTNFGILRAIVSDTDRAIKAIFAAGYAASLTDVLAVAVPDRPGGLADVLDALSGAGIAIEYLYSVVGQMEKCAVLIFRVEETERAGAVLLKAGARILTQEEISVI